MSSFSYWMFALWFIRLAEIRDCFSRVSTVIGIFGLGHLNELNVVFVEVNIFSICFFIIIFVVVLQIRILF